MEVANIIVLSLTFIAIVWYTIETYKLRKATEENNKLSVEHNAVAKDSLETLKLNISIAEETFALDSFYRVLDKYEIEYNQLKLTKTIEKEVIVNNEERSGQYYFETIFNAYKTIWLRNVIEGQTELADEEVYKNNMLEFMRLYKAELNIEKYLAQVEQTMLYVLKLSSEVKSHNRVFRKMFVRKLSSSELKFLYYYALTDKNMKELLNDLNIFAELELSEFDFLLNPTHNKFYDSVLVRFK